MTRRRLITVVAALAVALVLALVFRGAFAPSAGDVLKLVPDSAWGVVVFNKPASLDAKFRSLVSEMKLPAVTPLATLKKQSGVQGGEDENGTAAVILLPPDRKGMPPTTIVLIPVIDYDGFVQPFHVGNTSKDPVSSARIGDASCCIRHIGHYAAITDGSHREVLSAEKLSIAKEIPPSLTPWREWLASKDAAGLILQPGIQGISAQVQGGVTMMKTVLTAQIVADALQSKDTEQAKMSIAALDICSNAFQAAEKGVTACGFAAKIDKQNVVRVTNRMTLVSGGVVSRVVSDMQPVRQNLLSDLPDEPFAAAGGAAIPEAAWMDLARGSIGLLKTLPNLGSLTKKQVDQLSGIVPESLGGIEAASILFGTGQGGKPPLSNTVAVIRVESSQKFMENYEAFVRQYNDCIKDAKSPILQPVEIESIQQNGAAALQITTNVSIPQPPNTKDDPERARRMERLFGPGGKLVAWVMPVDEHRVVIGYVDKEHVWSVVEAIRQGKANLAANGAVAGLLPPDAAVAGCLSPSGVVECLQQMMSALLPPNAQNAPTLPPFPQTPPIRFAMTASPDALENSLIVPVEFLQAIAPYLEKVQVARNR